MALHLKQLTLQSDQLKTLPGRELRRTLQKCPTFDPLLCGNARCNLTFKALGLQGTRIPAVPRTLREFSLYCTQEGPKLSEASGRGGAERRLRSGPLCSRLLQGFVGTSGAPSPLLELPERTKPSFASSMGFRKFREADDSRRHVGRPGFGSERPPGMSLPHLTRPRSLGKRIPSRSGKRCKCRAAAELRHTRVDGREDGCKEAQHSQRPPGGIWMDPSSFSCKRHAAAKRASVPWLLSPCLQVATNQLAMVRGRSKLQFC